MYAEPDAEVSEDDDEDDDEIEFELTFKIPPTAPPGGEVDVVAFFARAANLSKVFPDVGAFIAPTMPIDCQ